MIAAGNDKLWREVCEAADRPELIDDPRFVTQTLRAKNQKELASLLQQSFSRKTAGEWLKEFDRRGVPCAPINDYEDILHDPAVHQIGLVKDLQLPNGLTTRTVPFPVKVTGYDFPYTAILRKGASIRKKFSRNGLIQSTLKRDCGLRKRYLKKSVTYRTLMGTNVGRRGAPVWQRLC